MRILVNTLGPRGEGGGITYLKNMLPRFAEDTHEYVILVPASRGSLTEPKAENVRFKTASSLTKYLPARLLFEQLVLPYLLYKWDVDVLFSPANLTTLLSPSPVLLMVRNPNPFISFGEYNLAVPKTEYVRNLVYRQLIRLSTKRADHVYFVSEYCKQSSNAYLNLPDSKISTIHHGIDHTEFDNPTEPTGQELNYIVSEQEPYILTVSTIREHKNYEVLIKAYRDLPSDLREEYPLLIAGRISSQRYFHQLRQLVEKSNLQDQVIFLGGVDYEFIPYLYSRAQLYVLPSKLETFGHTLVEAMSSGVPVIAANSTCIPEITDSAAELFDPNNHNELAAILKKCLEDDDLQQSLARRGRERSKDFSWDRTFEETRTLLEAVAETS